MSTLNVYADYQSKLLKLVAVCDDKVDRSITDLDAALVYLFFRERSVVSLSEHLGSLGLTHQELINLKDHFVYFLSAAEEMGFELEVNAAINRMDQEISSSTPVALKRKIFLKRCLKYLMVSPIILGVSWFLYSFETALVITYVGIPLCFAMKKPLEEFFQSIKKSIQGTTVLRFSKVLRKVNSKEIESRLKWAEDHLQEKGLI